MPLFLNLCPFKNRPFGLKKMKHLALYFTDEIQKGEDFHKDATPIEKAVKGNL